MKRISPLIVLGTRPEAIKLAPVIRECLRRADSIAPLVCSTGQHREMLRDVLAYFEIHIDDDLDLMQSEQSLARFASAAVAGLDCVIARRQPDCLVVQGDTTTVLAASLAAFYHRIPLVHVEAGLRTGNLSAPYPEEFNRRVASLSAAVHCAPTNRAAETLRCEGVPPERVHLTGNTVIDALLHTVDRERVNAAHWQARHGHLGSRPLVLVTGHRRENFGPPLESLCLALRQLASDFPDVQFVYPVHLNPAVREPAHRLLSGVNNIQLLPPVAYPEFVWLMDRSTLILTDSGGVQEEAPSLGKPVLLLREATERPEALQNDAVEVVGADRQRIVAAVRRLLTDPGEAARRRLVVSPFGDGQAARRIVDLIESQAWTR